MSFASGPIRISTESLVQQVGLSDPPELEEGNARAVGIALTQFRQTGTQDERNIFYNDLAARNVPALVEAFRQQGAANGPAQKLLNACSGSPHFLRFAKNPAGADLHKFFAKRLLEDVWHPGWRGFAFELQDSLQFFSTFLVVWGTDFDADTKKQLVRRITQWRDEYGNDPNVSQFSSRCLDILHPVGVDGREMVEVQLPYIRRMLSRGIDRCQMQGCNVSSGDGTLMACSRCKIKYCSVDHQRKDWREHKPYCLAPVF